VTKAARPARQCAICGEERPRGWADSSWFQDPPTCGRQHCEGFGITCRNYVPTSMPIHARFCSGRCRAAAWRREHRA
jgi:predicted nucleic acid-binding Zn ribbon protein